MAACEACPTFSAFRGGAPPWPPTSGRCWGGCGGIPRPASLPALPCPLKYSAGRCISSPGHQQAEEALEGGDRSSACQAKPIK